MNTHTSGAADLPAIQRYKIGYHSDDWGQRSSTPSGIPDASGSWVRYADHVAALAAGQAVAPVEKWADRIQRAHPKSEPEFWPDELRVKYMAEEIRDLRAQLESIGAGGVSGRLVQAISAEPAAHVQNPAENEHVAGDVSKNGAEVNMSTQQQECGNTPYDEGPIALAQPVAPRGAADGFFLLLPQRPKPEAPAGTAGLDWDAYSGAQMLAFGRDCSDAAIAALRTQQPAPGQQGTAAPTVEQVEDEVSMGHGAWDLIDPKELIGAVLRLASPPAADTGATAEPYGWLYDWTHSSATGRPDTTYTGFTKYEAHARKHDNCIAVFTAPHPAPAAGAVAGQMDDIDAVALARYKVEPSHDSMFHRFAVVAGDGQQQIYVGRETECQNMARKFSGAFLDGAFYQSNIAPTPPTQEAGSVLEDAARLDWLLLRISGAEFRRLGVYYSGNARRADVDAARKQGGTA